MTNTLTDLKKHAVASVGYQLDWARIDSNPVYRSEIERAFQTGANLQADLEPLYTKLYSSDTVKIAGHAELTADELTYYREVVSQELAACYRLEVLATTYSAINNVVAPLTDHT